VIRTFRHITVSNVNDFICGRAHSSQDTVTAVLVVETKECVAVLLLVAVGHLIIVFTFWFTACVFPEAFGIDAPFVLITLQGSLLVLVFFWLTACVFPVAKDIVAQVVRITQGSLLFLVFFWLTACVFLVAFGIDAPFVLITLQGILLFSFFWLFFIWLAAV